MMGSTDQAFSALITDMEERGLLAETLVCFVSEFGRTPKINKAKGRDHWTHAFSFAFAGAGGAPTARFRMALPAAGKYSLVIEATGTEDKIDSLLEVLKPYGVCEMVRTGLVAMARGTGAAERPAVRASRVAAASSRSTCRWRPPDAGCPPRRETPTTCQPWPVNSSINRRPITPLAPITVA